MRTITWGAAFALGMTAITLTAGHATGASPAAVHINQFAFAPAVLTVPAGATVTWTNDDNFTHNVTFDGEPGMQMRPGENVTKSFPTAGTFHYQCTLHPQNMQGTVTVKGS